MRTSAWILSLCAACTCSSSVETFDSGSDASPDAHRVDAPAVDAPLEDGGGVDAGRDAGRCPLNCVRTVVTWGSEGGDVASRRSHQVSECGRVARSDHDFTTGARTVCVAYVDTLECELVAQVADLLTDDDVRAARAAAPIVYGIDSRPVDGTVFRIAVQGVSEEEVIDIGDPCGGAPSCEDAPPGVLALREALERMAVVTDESDACAAPAEDPATFGCSGDRIQCLTNDEFCFSPFACRPTPEDCRAPARCDCLPDLGFECSEAGVGELTVQWTE